MYWYIPHTCEIQLVAIKENTNNGAKNIFIFSSCCAISRSVSFSQRIFSSKESYSWLSNLQRPSSRARQHRTGIRCSCPVWSNGFCAHRRSASWFCFQWHKNDIYKKLNSKQQYFKVILKYLYKREQIDFFHLIKYCFCIVIFLSHFPSLICWLFLHTPPHW